MDIVFGKILSFFGFSVIILGICAVLLLAVLLFRQQRLFSRMSHLEKSVDRSLASAQERNKVEAERQLTKIIEALCTIDPVIAAMNTFSQSLAEIRQEMHTEIATLHDTISTVSSSPSMDTEKLHEDISQIRGRIEMVQDELAKAHQWLQELRTLEKVVVNLIGPEKLKSLLEKEKANQVQTQAPSKRSPGGKTQSRKSAL